ncbi:MULTISPECIES: nuclear transport factor 2 family protein [Saccharibacillus]|uniref:nuclear transport factor 2 family protein n=1 Tax=Saccharibacillus TaxID=456492 RepID=UPI00123A7AC6|nr:nuclear transport factor 2 family protein [Saccharibacillus sp. WB 17]MWJ31210.1 nuclear transport factor 2 family protein [Saccharibacillus sp. WB 17]
MSTVTRARAEEIMSVFAQSFLQGDHEAFLDLFHENVRFDFPYAPDPYPKRLHGIGELRSHLEGLQDLFVIHSFSDPVIHRSMDGPVFTAEFEGHGTLLQSGRPYDQHYISVVELQQDRIIRYQDYWNPLSIG